MNIDNLKPGMIIPNYNALCNLLNLRPTSGKSKQLQLQDLERFVKYHKDKNRFIIEEIFSEPKIKIDLRSEGNKSIYSNLIQKLLLDLLSQKENNGAILLSTNRLLRALEMVNDNYIWGRSNMIKLSDIVQVGIEDIYDFYRNTQGNLQGALENALDKLERKSLIFWNKTIMLYSLKKDEDNNVEGTRLATEDEIEIIMETEKKVLISMNYADKPNIYMHNKWMTFTNKVNLILKNTYDIACYWYCYNIISIKRHYLLQELGELNRKLLQSELNNTIQKRLLINATNRQESAKENVWGDFPEELLSKITQTRLNSNYIKNTKVLIDTLINKNVDSIKENNQS